MPGTWTPLYGQAYSRKKTLAAAKELKIDVEDLLGHLGRFWNWAVDNAEDGDVGHLDDATIGHIANWLHGRPARFGEVIRRQGFIDADGSIHDWDEHVGTFIAARQYDRHRMRVQRKVKQLKEQFPKLGEDELREMAEGLIENGRSVGRSAEQSGEPFPRPFGERSAGPSADSPSLPEHTGPNRTQVRDRSLRSSSTGGSGSGARSAGSGRVSGVRKDRGMRAAGEVARDVVDELERRSREP